VSSLNDLKALKSIEATELQSKIDDLEQDLNASKFNQSELRENLGDALRLNQELHDLKISLQYDCKDLYSQLIDTDAEYRKTLESLEAVKLLLKEEQEKVKRLSSNLSMDNLSIARVEALLSNFDLACQKIVEAPLKKEKEDVIAFNPEPPIQSPSISLGEARDALLKLKELLDSACISQSTETTLEVSVAVKSVDSDPVQITRPDVLEQPVESPYPSSATTVVASSPQPNSFDAFSPSLKNQELVKSDDLELKTERTSGLKTLIAMFDFPSGRHFAEQ
jgi:hypothetical protein